MPAVGTSSEHRNFPAADDVEHLRVVVEDGSAPAGWFGDISGVKNTEEIKTEDEMRAKQTEICFPCDMPQDIWESS